VRRRAKQHLALSERFLNESELEELEVAKAAVNQLRRSRRRPAGKVALLAKKYGQASAGGVPGNAASIYPAADHSEIDERPRHPPPRIVPAALAAGSSSFRFEP
jgi:hypothetical protein